MAGYRSQQRVRQQKVFYQCEPEGSSHCVCLDRKFIATQELLPVEEVERLASSVLAGSCETTALTMIVYPDRLSLQIRNQGTQLPEIFYDDIIQFEAVPNMADTFFLLSGRKSSVGMYFFLWFSDPSVVTKIRHLITTANPSVRLVSGPTHDRNGTVNNSPINIGTSTGSQRRLSSPPPLSTTQVYHQQRSHDANKKDTISHQNLFVQWTGRPKTRRQHRQRPHHEDTYSIPHNELPKRNRSAWRRGRSARSTSASESRSGSSSRSSSTSGVNQGSVFYLIKRRPRKDSNSSQPIYRSQSHSKNRRRPVVSPIIRAPIREQRDPIYASMPTSSLPRQRNAGNHVHQHYNYPTSASTVFNNSLQNERQPKVKFNLYPPKPVHYTPPESSTRWSDEETSYSESDEDYDDGTASLISSPCVTNRVRVAQLSSSPSPSRIQPPPISAHPTGSRCETHSSRNINMIAQHVRDEESVQSDDTRSFDSLYSEDASSTPYPTHGATYVNELSQRLHQRRLI
ncbi:hypothetical protein SprV_0100123400 [Sparganum proliferum]